MHGIVGAFYDAAGSGAGRLDQMAERTVRAACLSLVGSFHRLTMDLDQAYEYAHGRALLAQVYAGNASIVASPKWRAYEHIFAAEKVGVRPIGREFVEEAAIALRWTTQESAPILVDYLDATLCRSDEHVQILHSVDYRRFVDGAAVAANLLSASIVAPHAISHSYFHWLLTLPDEYCSRLKMHLAVMMDEGLLDHAREALIAIGRKETPRAEADDERRWRRTSRVKRPDNDAEPAS